MRLDRFTVFNHLWAIAGFCEWTRWTFTETGWSWALLVASLALLVFPRSVACLALFAAVQILFTALAANRPWNHGLFMALMNLAVLVSIARCRRERGQAVDPELLVDTFGPVLRLSLIALYAMTFFHKLNADFVNPAVSCAGWLLGELSRAYRIVPADEWAVVGSIWGTLFVELAVPLLLCFRRSAPLGLAIGAAFHLFLSQFGGLHGFAAMLFAVYFLFLPRPFAADLAERAARWLPLGPFGLLGAGVGALVVWGVLGRGFGVHPIYRGLVFWDVWLLAVIVLLGRELVSVWRTPADFTLRPRWAPLGVVPLVVVLNGFSPYVGLKTETSWAMYSNLRTEVHPNHFLVPASAKVFGYQEDLVEILATSLPALQEYVGGDVRLTFFELRRMCSATTGDFAVSYRRHGEVRTLDPATCRAHPWLVGKLLRFRPVDVGAHARCRH